MNGKHQVKVWDPLVRIFHWALVAAFTIAYFTDDEALLLPHVWAGYAIIGLLLVRLVWGFVGSTHARFSDFLYAPAAVLRFVRDTFKGRARRYLGHNPAGGWMVVLLLVMLALIGVTGLMLYGADEHAGPLASAMAGLGRGVTHDLEELHEFFANFTVFLVAVHVAGVALESFLHKESLVRAMITGRKRADSRRDAGNSHVNPRRKGPVIAGVLLVMLGGFGAGMPGGADRVQADPAEVDLIEMKDLQPLEEIIAKAKARHDGQLIEAELKRINSIDIYEIEILDDDGRVWEMYFNAKTGKLLNQEEEIKNESTGR